MRFQWERSTVLAAVALAALAGCAERDTQDAPGMPAAAPAAQVPPAPVAVESAPAETIAALVPVAFALGEAMGPCNIETVNAELADGIDVRVDAGDTAVVEGWALSADGVAPAIDWRLVVASPEGAYFEVSSIQRVDRLDLVSRAGAATAAAAGFRATFIVPEAWRGRAGLFFAGAAGDVRPHCAMGRGFVVEDR